MPYPYDDPEEALIAEAIQNSQGPTLQGLMDMLAMGTMTVPVVGDVAGLGADALRMYQNPEERTLGNAALASLGILPFVPPMGAVKNAGASLQEALAKGVNLFPERMAATNKAIQEGGNIASATDRDYMAIMTEARARAKNKEGKISELAKLSPEEVAQRQQIADIALSQPIQKYTPSKYALLDRSAMDFPLSGGAPGVQQQAINRYQPTARSDVTAVETINTPEARDLAKRMIERGVDATQGGFYKSYQPMRGLLDELGYAPDVFEKGLASGSFASAQNKVSSENAIQSLVMGMVNQGIPLTKENLQKVHDQYKGQFGTGLSMMYPTHVAPFAKYLDQGFPSGEKTSQKIASFFNNKTGNFEPYTLDTHEAGGLMYNSPYAAYFRNQGGFGETEYGIAEKAMQDLSKSMGLAPAVGQEARWFGGGDLTGLQTGGGDWLDNFEKQAVYSAIEQGKDKMTKEQARKFIADVYAGKEKMLPWNSKTVPIPDKRSSLIGMF